MIKNQKQTKPWYKRKRNLIPLGIFLAPFCLILIGILGSWYEASRPSYYERGSEFPLDDLPDSAKDIYFRPRIAFDPWGRTYEFTCTEEEFRSWVDRKRIENPKLSEIRKESNFYCPIISREGSIEMESIDEVLVSDWRFEDQGSFCIYDLSRKRALRWSHSR
jgi:hypothetical protein